MTDRDEQLETQLRARSLPGLSAEAQRRLLADLALAALDHDNPPTEATTDQILPIATRTHRQTIWRTMITHRYAAACVAVIICTAIAGPLIVAHRTADDDDSDLALHRSSPTVVAHGSSANGKSIAEAQPSDTDLATQHLALEPLEDVLKGPPTSSLLQLQPLRTRSNEETVAAAEVIVVATFMDSTPAKSNGPGDETEAFLRFRVVRILKGELDKKTVTVWHRFTAGRNVNDLVREGEESILVLTPEFMAGSPYAWIAPIELEPEFRAILAAQQGKP